MLRKIIYALGALVALGLIGVLVWVWPGTVAQQEGAPTIGEPGQADAPVDAETTVVLTAEKTLAANIQVGTAEQMSLQAHRTIPGRLDYDQDRHVAINSACSGIVTDIRVQPGDEVNAGQIVAVISSPEVGTARAEVRSRLADVKLAETRQKWQAAICSGVEELAKMVQQNLSPEAITSRLEGDSMGDYREKIISAYTRAQLARTTAANTRDAANQGAIAASTQQKRESEVQAAEAALQAVIEQSLFEVQQQCKSATAELEQAERLVEISLQKLNTLLGPAAQPVGRAEFTTELSEVDSSGDTNSSAALLEQPSLSLVNLLAPIDGTVEERSLSVSERAVAGEKLFTVANVSQLWAVADVRERDWDAMTVGIGERVQIASPAIRDRSFSGEVIRIGRRVDPATGAAQLIARLEAYDRRLRPGLFIRMTVPISEPRQALCVPEQAVVVHDGQHFVFLAENESTFRRQDVEVGETQSGVTEITEGLTAGQKIAISGVFQLKSELLLAGEEE